MRSKYDRKPIGFPGLNTKDHWLMGVVWPVVGSTGNNYDVEFVPGGFKCNCTGFTMHGKCKHVLSVWNRLGETPKQYRWNNDNV